MPIDDVPIDSQSDQEEDASAPINLADALRRASVLPAGTAMDGPVAGPNLAAAYGKAQVPDALFAGIDNAPRPTTIGQRILQIGQPPAAPVMDPEYEPAMAQYQKDLQPLDRARREYHMGIGGRILGTLGNLFTGGVGGAVAGLIRPGMAPIYVGKGATNNRYSQDESARQERLGNEESRLKLLDEDYGRRDRQYKNDLAQYEDQAHLAGAQDARELQQYQSEGKERNQQQQQELRRETQEARSPRGQAQSRIQILNEINVKLTPKERRSYILTGKLPDDEYKAKQLQIREAELGLKREQFKGKQKPAISK